LIEFTGERVVPGEVGADLWNEHFARYAFVARLSARKTVLDAGCGTGYGAAELARAAASVVGVDVFAQAVEYARTHYPSPNLRFLQASCTSLPFASGAFDLVVAFEVIEHLREWREFLGETRRVLAPRGQCVISTPNRDYYTASRGQTGANPFHEHEFSFEEFREELQTVFPYVAMFLQNHVDGVVFQPAGSLSPAEARLDRDAGLPEHSNFFIAVCAMSRQTGAPTFLYMPRAANVLREREQHIEKLEGQITESTEERDELLALFRQQKEELEERNRWAGKLNDELEEARAKIVKLQGELQDQATGYEAKIRAFQEEQKQQVTGYESQIQQLQQEIAQQAAGYEAKIDKFQEEQKQQAAGYESQIQQLQREIAQHAAGYEARIGEFQEEQKQQATGYESQIQHLQQEIAQHAAGYDAKVAELEEDNRGKAEWAIRLAKELAEKQQELADGISSLRATERSLQEEQRRALQLAGHVQELEALLNLVRESRWVKLGNSVGMGPRLRDE